MTRCPIFCYHGVTGDPRIYDVRPEMFRKQVEYLDDNFTVLTVGEMYRLWDRGELPENPAVLTFDDGLRSTFEAVDILDERGIDATFYIISGLLGETWEGRDVMTAEEVGAISERGHEIGAHTVSHPMMTHFPRQEMRREAELSRQRLEDIVGEKVDSFAYPYGDLDGEVVEIVEDAGFQTAVTTWPSSRPQMDEPLRLPRLGVLRYHDMRYFRKLAEGRDPLRRCYWRYRFHLLRSKFSL